MYNWLLFVDFLSRRKYVGSGSVNIESILSIFLLLYFGRLKFSYIILLQQMNGKDVFFVTISSDEKV